ncbi:thiamine phosphate synthase [bacterium SCSIO 12643]|nr:thiamine phosphate synthase [bacterium SCSIO 12643]
MDKWYYISQEYHLQNIQNVCEAGIRLVQLRAKNLKGQELLELALAAQQICKTHQATFIINDHVALAKEIHADGVHLGQNDISPIEARELLAPHQIIGGTANTFEDCKKLIAQKVDYIGLGPFRYTTTKKNLSPILGLEGYQSIVSKLKHAGATTPIYAIGGITQADFNDLLKTNIYGIAISGLISHQSPESIKDILAIPTL